MTTIALGQYLWRRIKEMGIETVMGLPGDFNLQLLDHIYKVDGLRWIGTANELNAAYAVDGYSRIKNVPGCIVTTHGVGELSALNGIAGSLTEQVRVIHIVGQTTRAMQGNRLMIHHSIGFNPDHKIFQSASARFRVADAELWDVKNAVSEIDRVLRECFIKTGPVYIFFPLDLVDEQVPSELLEVPLDLSLPRTQETESTAKKATDAIISAITSAKRPVVFVDGLVMRHGAVNELRALLSLLRFPTFSSGIGIGIVDPKAPHYLCSYSGKVSNPGADQAFQDSDLILTFGRLPCDTNTGGFTQHFPPEKVIDFRPAEVEVFGKTIFPGLYYQELLPQLTAQLGKDFFAESTMPVMPKYRLTHIEDNTSDKITTPWFWPRFSDFLRSGDSIVGDTGTSLLGLLDCSFPSDITFNSQTYYGSIGYATPAAMGADFARQDLARDSTHTSARRAQSCPRRTVLVTGDGSIQLTIQELGTMIKHGAKPVIVVINNAGYTVERVIHGAKQPYNDIASYDWSQALRFFGMDATRAESSFVRCHTKAEFETVLKQQDRWAKPENVMILEIMMDAFDSPWRLTEQIGLRGEATRQEMRDGGFVLRQPEVVQ